MDWPQIWDKGQEFTRQCGIHSFPTYVLVSPEGEILHVVGGWGQDTERDPQPAGSRRPSETARKSAKPAR